MSYIPNESIPKGVITSGTTKRERVVLSAKRSRQSPKPKTTPAPVGHEAFLEECIQSGAKVLVLGTNDTVNEVKILAYDKFSVHMLHPESGQKVWIFKHAISGLGTVQSEPSE